MLTCDRCLSGNHRCLTPACACACRPIAARALKAIDAGEATAPTKRSTTPPPLVHGRAGNYHRGLCKDACCREPAMEAQRQRRAAKRKMSEADNAADNTEAEWVSQRKAMQR